MTICTNARNMPNEAGGLSRLSTVAARTARVQGGDIALVRGDSRSSRRRASQLRSTMQQRGTRAVELTSVDAIDTARRQVTTITAVVDLTASDVSDAHRLAAHLSVPLFTLDESGTAGPGAYPHSRRPGSPELVERDAISLSADRYQDIALSRVTVASCGPERAAIELLLNSDDPIRFDDTEISARLRNRFLEIEATTPGRPARHFRETRCALRVLAGRFIVVRDGTPTADLYGPLSIAACPRRIAIHTITAQTANS
jgi:hypothetical protein